MGKSKTPHGGKRFSLAFLPATPSPLKGFYSWYGALPGHSNCLLASGTTKIKGYCRVWRARRGAPRTPTSRATNANLDRASVHKNALFIWCSKNWRGALDPYSTPLLQAKYNSLIALWISLPNPRFSIEYSLNNVWQKIWKYVTQVHTCYVV